jgi:rubrerythrin
VIKKMTLWVCPLCRFLWFRSASDLGGEIIDNECPKCGHEKPRKDAVLNLKSQIRERSLVD